MTKAVRSTASQAQRAAYHREWLVDHPGYMKSYMKSYRATPEYKERHVAYERARRAVTDQRDSERARYRGRREQVLGRIKERTYGVAPAEYAEMLYAQHGVCAICGHAETVRNGKTHTVATLSIDHDHSTGRVRGLLCQRCNRALGGFRDDPGILQAALAYITREESS